MCSSPVLCRGKEGREEGNRERRKEGKKGGRERERERGRGREEGRKNGQSTWNQIRVDWVSLYHTAPIIKLYKMNSLTTVSLQGSFQLERLNLNYF